MPDSQSTPRKKPRFGRVFGFVAHYWMLSPGLFGALLIARIASTLVDVSVPFASGRLVDAVASGARDNPAPAFWALALLLGLGAAFMVSRQAVSFMLNRLSVRAITAIGRDAFAKVQRFSSDWHANSFAGATVRKITRGMNSFDTFTDTLAFNLLPALIVVIGVTVIFSLRWPWLGALVGVGIVVFIGVSVALSILWVSPANRAAREMDSKMSGTLADSVTGNPTVKSFAAEEREDRLFFDVSGSWAHRSLISWDRAAWTGLAQTFMLIVLEGVMLTSGIFLWSEGQATPGDIASIIATQFLISAYLRDIAQHVRQIQRTINDMDDVLDFRDADIDVADRSGARALAVARGAISFDKVIFRYKGARGPVFENFTLEIPAGQQVGLVGHSGSGKSTFVKLIQRLYDLESGRILIDGQDIAAVTQASLREAVGLVPQDPILFHRSLAENIAYGRPGVTMDDIREAARLAHAAEFIEGLSRGYDTLVGERGIKLSGGERQRVAIARAILANTPILVLDEATSSLDSISERFIRQAIERLSAGRTTIVVAHRLSTIQRLDRILVFDHGKVVEDGTHAQLLARPDGVYRRLLDVQLGTGEIAAAAE
jgi:ATP-binding cassette subfamily B protein